MFEPNEIFIRCFWEFAWCSWHSLDDTCNTHDCICRLYKYKSRCFYLYWPGHWAPACGSIYQYLHISLEQFPSTFQTHLSSLSSFQVQLSGLIAHHFFYYFSLSKDELLDTHLGRIISIHKFLLSQLPKSLECFHRNHANE